LDNLAQKNPALAISLRDELANADLQGDLSRQRWALVLNFNVAIAGSDPPPFIPPDPPQSAANAWRAATRTPIDPDDDPYGGVDIRYLLAENLEEEARNIPEGILPSPTKAAYTFLASLERLRLQSNQPTIVGPGETLSDSLVHTVQWLNSWLPSWAQ
jgi:hypothetical protein